MNLAPDAAAESWCPACAAEADSLTLEEAAVMSGASARAICRWAEAGMVHLFEAPNGVRRVCLNSPLVG